MIDRVVSKSELDDFLDQLSVMRQVVAPVSDGKILHFRPINKAKDVADAYIPTALPPSLVVLPTKETLFRFDQKDRASDVQPQFDDHDVLLFGIRPCDLHGLELLDAIFADDKHDGHYITRRQHLTMVGVECLEPCDDYCFCESMGTLTVEEGYDLLLTDLGDAFYVKVGTTKGKELVDTIPTAREAVYEDRSKLRRAHERREEAFVPRLDAGIEQLPGLLAESTDSLLWDVLGEKCLSCGACTTVCPTCYCFDVHDDINLDMKSGERYRAWDSCQLDEFAMVGTNESFRKPRSLRVKHRVNRKGHYIRERYGLAGCVGCGRCGRNCIVDINLIEVFNQLKGQPVER